MSGNVADPEQVRQAGKKEALALKQDELDLQSLLDAPQGRRFIWRMLSACGIFKTSFDKDAVLMAFREGARNVGVNLLSEIMAVNPDAFTTMQKEAKKREEPNA